MPRRLTFTPTKNLGRVGAAYIWDVPTAGILGMAKAEGEYVTSAGNQTGYENRE